MPCTGPVELLPNDRRPEAGTATVDDHHRVGETAFRWQCEWRHDLSSRVRADTLTAVMRTFLDALLAVAFVVLVPLANLGAWAQRELVGTTPFVRLGEQVLDQSAVRAALADRIVTSLESANPALIATDGQIRAFVAQELASPAVRPAFDDLLASTHDQLRQGHDPLQLDLSSLLPVLRQQVPPNLAARLPTSVALAPVTGLRRSDAPAVW